MATVWGPDDVLALAPDAGAAQAGRALANPSRWARMGRGESVLWGECPGSGARPYQTTVDLTGPAYHCSCPSRKFPCKHALGLFLLWAGQPEDLPETAPPSWVSSWLEARAQRAEKKAAKPPEEEARPGASRPTGDLEKRTRSQAKRWAAVQGGLDELAVWLGDLVRQGLATVQGQSPSFWEDRARRLIDAKAPGAARRVLRLANLPAVGEGWQAAFLEHLARMHLLIEGARRLDCLSPEVRADIQTAIGISADQSEVRAGPSVRDFWMVIGHRPCRDVLDPQLIVHRKWLIGRNTGHRALILDFRHRAEFRRGEVKELELERVPPPGLGCDAELAFFPSAAPLRALVAHRHGEPERIESLPAQPTIEAAYAEYAEALARNPWLDRWPLVVGEVVPEFDNGEWRVRDTSGRVLSLGRRFERGWHLLALAAGGPLSLAGAFDGDVFQPLACQIDNRFIALATPDMSGDDLPESDEEETAPSVRSPLERIPELAELWKEATTSALVGIERRPMKLRTAVSGATGGSSASARECQTLADELPVAPKRSFAHIVCGLESLAPPERLLGLAAAASLYGRAGLRPPIGAELTSSACEPDERPCCGPLPTARLRRLIDEQRFDLLDEWLAFLAKSGCRLPDVALPRLLDMGRKQTALRATLLPALGRRGRWLAALNPDWSYVGGIADAADPESTWQTGKRPERLNALRAIREQDASRGRELLASTWASESANDRAAFLGALEVGLGPDDEPFLEKALDDRGKTVRKAAAELLVTLPESHLALRMSERARACVRWRNDRIEVEPPAECDAAMVRDGIEPKPPQGWGPRSWWLRQVVIAAPLSTWSGAGAPVPERWIEAALRTEWGAELWVGWAEAAARERHVDWIISLLKCGETKRELIWERCPKLVALLPGEDRDAFCTSFLRGRLGSNPMRRSVYDLLRLVPAPWSVGLGREVLDNLRREDAHIPDYSLWQFVRELGRWLPPEMADDAAWGWPEPRGPLNDAVDQMIGTLRLRREMQQEFEQ